MKIYMEARFASGNSHFIDLMIYSRLARTIHAGTTTLEDVGRSLNGAGLTLTNRAKMTGEKDRNPKILLWVDNEILQTLLAIPGVTREGLILGYKVADVRRMPELMENPVLHTMFRTHVASALAQNPPAS